MNQTKIAFQMHSHMLDLGIIISGQGLSELSINTVRIKEILPTLNKSICLSVTARETIPNHS